jgi:hypothetical protein
MQFGFTVFSFSGVRLREATLLMAQFVVEFSLMSWPWVLELSIILWIFYNYVWTVIENLIDNNKKLIDIESIH